MQIKIQVDDLWTFVYTDDQPRLLSYIVGDLMAEVPGAKYTWKFKTGEWDGRVQLFTQFPDAVAFRTGLLESVLTRFLGHGVQISSFNHAVRRPCTVNWSAHSANPVQLRPYQKQAVNAMLNNKLPPFNGAGQLSWHRGILQVATGGGKTEIAVALYQRNPVQTMFLVHRKDLLYQAKERFAKYGIKTGILGDGKWDIAHPIIIATMQTLMARMEDIGVIGLCAKTDQVFFDEAHLMASSLDKGNQFTKVADMFSSARYRWGLTATPFMRSKYDNLLLEGVTGKVLYQISNADLIAQGHLTPPKVIMKRVPGLLPVAPPKFNPRKRTAGGAYWREVEETGIKFNAVRTEIIADEIAKGPHPVLVLSKTVDQAEFIREKYLQKYGVRLLILTGKATAAARRDAVADLKTGVLKAVIATTIFDEGVDIPELQKVILASGGKSQVKGLQRVGRGLRTSAGKDEVIIVDFQDTHHTMLRKHALERLKVWKDEGFEVLVEGKA